ncbi:MAG: hypothetical protein ACWGQW_02630 [bacterium]
MAVLINSSSTFGANNNGWVGQSSGGTKAALFFTSAQNAIQAWTGIDSSPSQIGSTQAATDFLGAGVSQVRFHAAIDSNNVVHVFAVGTGGATRDTAYNTISDLDSSPAWGTWSSGPSFDQNPGTQSYVSVSINSNDYPGVAYVDRSKVHGTNYSQVFYTEWNGSSWSTPVNLSGNGEINYYMPRITFKASDNMEIIYNNNSDDDFYYQTRTSGTWSGESASYAASLGLLGRPTILVTTGGTVYRYYRVNSSTIYENGVTIGNAQQAGRFGVWLDPATGDRYVLYSEGNIGAGYDINILVNSGSGWSEQQAVNISTSSFPTMLTGWCYNNLNNADSIDFIYEDGNLNVYWEEWIVNAAAAGSSPFPSHARVLRNKANCLIRR